MAPQEGKLAWSEYIDRRTKLAEERCLMEECLFARRILLGETDEVKCGGVFRRECVQAFLKYYTGSEADYP